MDFTTAPDDLIQTIIANSAVPEALREAATAEWARRYPRAAVSASDTSGWPPHHTAGHPTEPCNICRERSLDSPFCLECSVCVGPHADCAQSWLYQQAAPTDEDLDPDDDDAVDDDVNTGADDD